MDAGLRAHTNASGVSGFVESAAASWKVALGASAITTRCRPLASAGEKSAKRRERDNNNCCIYS